MTKDCGTQNLVFPLLTAICNISYIYIYIYIYIYTYTYIQVLTGC